MLPILRRSIYLALTALLFWPLPASVFGSPTVLTFDDVVTDGLTPVLMPVGYGGVNWPSNVGVYGVDEGPYYVPKSAPNRVLFNYFPPFEVPETIVSFIGGPKIFDGAFFSGALHNVHFNLYSGTTLVGVSSTLSFGDLGGPPIFLASGYAGPVDSVGIVGSPGLIVMDNFTFETVPEPSAVLLFGISAISIFSFRRARSIG